MVPHDDIARPTDYSCLVRFVALATNGRRSGHTRTRSSRARFVEELLRGRNGDGRPACLLCWGYPCHLFYKSCDDVRWPPGEAVNTLLSRITWVRIRCRRIKNQTLPLPKVFLFLAEVHRPGSIYS